MLNPRWMWFFKRRREITVWMTSDPHGIYFATEVSNLPTEYVSCVFLFMSTRISINGVWNPKTGLGRTDPINALEDRRQITSPCAQSSSPPSAAHWRELLSGCLQPRGPRGRLWSAYLGRKRTSRSILPWKQLQWPWSASCQSTEIRWWQLVGS